MWWVESEETEIERCACEKERLVERLGECLDGCCQVLREGEMQVGRYSQTENICYGRGRK